MRHVQFWHGTYRVRKPIPKALQAIARRGQYLTRSLGTADPREADKRAPAVLAEFQEILDRAERIMLGDVQVYCMMAGLPKEHLLALANLRADEQDLLLNFAGHGLPAEPTSRVVPFATIIDAWALEHSNPKTKDDYTAKCRKLTDFLGYDDAARVTPEEIVRFKKHLLTAGFAPKSVQNVFAGVKRIFKFGVANKEIATDPTVGIAYKAKRDPKRKRQPFTFAEARSILTAARDTGSELFFPNLIGAFSGTRLAEVVEAHTDDVEMIDGLWCLNLREDNREQNQTLKNEPSVRKLPLHEEIIQQGFITYAHSLPKGPLFPQYRKNKYNRRNDHASKKNSEFVRGLGITDRRKAPMHSWRHYFKTVARGLIEEQISDAISGHRSESEGRQYGTYELRLMAEAIAKLPNPLSEGIHRLSPPYSQPSPRTIATTCPAHEP
jgi:integrase